MRTADTDGAHRMESLKMLKLKVDDPKDVTGLSETGSRKLNQSYLRLQMSHVFL